MGRDKSKNREVDAACLRLPGPTRSRADSAWSEVRATGPDYPNAKATQANPQVSAEGVAQLDGCMLGAPIDRAGRAQTPYAYAGFSSPSGRADDLSAARAGFRPVRATDRRAEDGRVSPRSRTVLAGSPRLGILQYAAKRSTRLSGRRSRRMVSNDEHGRPYRGRGRPACTDASDLVEGCVGRRA